MPASDVPILKAEGLTRSYDGREVLRGISLELSAGGRLALMGPSGSGKTTLLNCLGGIDRPDGGRLFLRGTPMESLTPDALAAVRRRDIGSIFQFFHLLPTLTASENIELPLQLNGIPARERRTISSASFTSSRMRRARVTRSRPIGVSWTGLSLRSTRVTPSRASSARICWLSVGWAMCTASAARRKFRESARATR